MYIRCWGSRGSIPVSGPSYLKYGGETTCMEIRSEKGDLIVIDAGSGLRCLGDSLAKEKVKKIDLLFTHAHYDHIIGFPFFAPFLYNKASHLTIHGCPFNTNSYRDVIKGIMTAPYCPVELKMIPAKLTFNKVCSKPFKIGPIKITPIMLSHPNGGLGYKFEEGGKSFVFLTDNELDYIHPTGQSFEDYIEFCDSADLLIHDAEYTTKDYNRSWGHSTLNSTLKLSLSAGVKKLGLFHLNQRRTDKQVDAMVASARKMVDRKKSDMEVFAVSNTFEIKLK